jgi:hypothetical protein
MKKMLTMAVITAIALSGCASQKNWGASGGSKADGTVKLAYTYGMFEVPKVDNAQAQATAVKRCKAWGYETAVAFDFVDKRCQQMTQSGCSATIVTQEYQCE